MSAKEMFQKTSSMSVSQSVKLYMVNILDLFWGVPEMLAAGVCVLLREDTAVMQAEAYFSEG